MSKHTARVDVLQYFQISMSDRNWDASEVAEKILALLTGGESPIQKLAEVNRIPDEVDLTRALMIREPVVRFKDRNTRVREFRYESFGVLIFDVAPFLGLLP